MKYRFLQLSAAMLLSILIFSIGCSSGNDKGDNGNTPSAAAAQAADTQPQASKPPAVDTSLPPLKQTQLKPLPLPVSGGQGAPPAKLAKPVSSAEPALLATTAKNASAKPLNTSAQNDQPPGRLPKPLEPLKNSAVASTSELHANPLRETTPPVGITNPMRQSATQLAGEIKPNGPFQSQPIAQAPPVPVGATAKQPQSEPQQTLPTRALPAQRPSGQLPAAQPPLGQAGNGAQSPLSSPPVSTGAVGKGKKGGSSTFDPIKENGPIFEGWEKPKLAIVITGREDGYIEPCGCAGLDKMKGGLSRRHTMIEQLRAKGWPLLCVDAGGLSKGYGVQAELKFQITVNAMKKMGYEGIGFSPNDLRLPVGLLISVADGTKNNPSPFVSANVGLLGFEAKTTKTWRAVDVGDYKVGVTSILGKEYQKDLDTDDIEFSDPEKALEPVMKEMNKDCHLKILLAYASHEECVALSKKFEDFAVVVSAIGPPSPPAKETIIDKTKALLIDVGEKGMDAVVLGLFDNIKQPYRYQRVPLDSRFDASKYMKILMKNYQERLRDMGLSGLAVKPVTHPSHAVNGNFVGSKECRNCHEASYDIWKKSGHAKAWATLVNADPPRNFDPECISCHVIGWHPTKYFPYKSGFLSEKLTPKMIDVGCESCHGPGEAHVKAEMGNDEALQLRMQKAVRVTLEEAKNHSEKACRNCHDLDNSPDFDFETYWPKVEHKESE